MVDLDDPTMEPATSTVVVASTPVLRLVFSGEQPAARDFPLEAQRLDIGRSVVGPEDIRIEQDPRLSRHHATISVRGIQARVRNASSHGTWVNQQRLGMNEEAVIDDGAVLRLGDSFFVFRLMPDIPRDAACPGVLGRSPAVTHLRTLIDVVGPSPASVLLLGETGVGKEVAARALHARSGRAGPFIAVNCAAIPENLAESQLFGHKAGAFTGASRDHAGVFREAHGGTLLLDELGELPLTVQSKLLRVLDERIVHPVGAAGGVPVDVRVVAATNRRLAEEVSRQAFRGDLFARLAEITLLLPPLRARLEDVVVLMQAAIPALHAGAAVLAPQLVHALLLHAWPFNVRELMKVCTELEVKAQGRRVLDVDLLEGRALGPGPAPSGASLSPVPFPAPPPLAAPVAAPSPSAFPSPFPALSSPPSPVAPRVSTVEGQPVTGAAPLAPRPAEVSAPTRDELEALLAAHRGRVSDVARVTGRSRTQVYRWLEEHGLSLDRFRS